MRCSSCNKNSALCGCSDGPFTTNIQTVCEPNAQCPEPIPCSEYMSAACVYLNDGVYDAGIEPGTSLEEAVQQLTLLITNPDCTTAPAGCECQGGGGTYSVINGLQPDDTDPNVFKLGGELIEDTTIDGVDNGFILTLSALKAFNVLNAGEILLESLDEIGLKGIDINFYKSSGPRMMGINELLGQLTLDGYYGGTGILYTNAPAYGLGVDSTGNVFKIPYNNTSGIVGPIDADNGITPNTTTSVQLGGTLVTDTDIPGGATSGGPWYLRLGSLDTSDPMSEISLHANQINIQTPAIAAATAAPGQVPVLIDDATGEIEFRAAITFTATGSGAATYDPATGALNIPNNPTATPDPPIFATLPGLSTTPAWDPSSFSTSTSNFIYVVPADTAIITGLVPGAARFVDGGLVTIQNGADNALLLIETNPGTSDPTPANRFVSPDGSGIVLMPGKALTFFYNARASRWVDINNYDVSTPFTSFEDFTGLPNTIAVGNTPPNYLVNSPLREGRVGMFNVLSTGITGNAGLGAGTVETGCLGTGILSAAGAPTPNIYLWAGRGQLGAIYSTESYSNPRLFAAKGKVSTSATSLNDFTATVGLTQGVHISIPSALLVGGFSYQLANSSTNWFVYAGTNTPIDTGISAVDSHVGMYIYTGTNLNKVQCITWARISTLNPAHRWTINNFTTGLPILTNAQTNAPMISFNRTVGTLSGTFLSIDWAGLVKQKRT